MDEVTWGLYRTKHCNENSFSESIFFSSFPYHCKRESILSELTWDYIENKYLTIEIALIQGAYCVTTVIFLIATKPYCSVQLIIRCVNRIKEKKKSRWYNRCFVKKASLSFPNHTVLATLWRKCWHYRRRKWWFYMFFPALLRQWKKFHTRCLPLKRRKICKENLLAAQIALKMRLFFSMWLGFDQHIERQCQHGLRRLLPPVHLSQQ